MLPSPPSPLLHAFIYKRDYKYLYILGFDIVALIWTLLAAAADHRRCMQLWPSSDDDAQDSSAWGAVLTYFPHTSLANVVVAWLGASRHGSGGYEFV
jgi:hypothetical protein